jgi:aspartyl protease
MDGILGIGRLQNVASNPTGVKAPTIVDVLATQKIIPSRLVGIRLSRSSDGSNNGEINFGAPDTSAYSGDLNYISAVTNMNGFWEIPLGSVSFNGKNAAIQNGVTVLLDSGTSYMLLPPDDAKALHAIIPGSSGTGETYTVPCDTSMPLVLTLGGKTYSISSKDYVGSPGSSGGCNSNIIGRATFAATQWLVGDVFLKNVYTVFDYDGSRVGLAQEKGLLSPALPHWHTQQTIHYPPF